MQPETLPVAETLERYPYTGADGSIPAYAAAEVAPATVAFDPLGGEYEDFGGAGDGAEYVELPMEHYSSLEDFFAKNNGRGQLTVRVSSSVGGSPVAGANVKVTAAIGSTQYVFYDMATDASGAVSRLALPAPVKQISFTPPQTATPYALYDITVTGAGANQVFRNVTIFADTESVQDVHIAPGLGEQTLNEALYLK
jgi:hypothetical protein